VSYSSAEAQASCFIDRTRSLRPAEVLGRFEFPRGSSVASVSADVDSDRTDPVVNSARADILRFGEVRL